ncbi:putative receptor-like protein kinase At1g80870 [Magnolia sinica]|uniref:putative receptor-like protein kinase At1g80870 n=1 Tax=Magnolia sinica TaxID=86752 RepID=UPI0026583C4B|nr:putative receptor-like protein kinase At1g80870 [Magnolia sinica]
MPSRPFPSHPPPPNSKTTLLFLSLIISSSVIFILALILLLLYLYFSFSDRRTRTLPFDTNAPLKLQKFPYKDLRSATNSFDPANTVGRGGSGAVVFRGILPDGKSVAIKALDAGGPSAASNSQSEREFQNELQILSSLRSPFVVTLLGYCFERKKRLLVYEYMPNRSLQDALFGESGIGFLDWDRRFGIVLDVARALEFLHVGCNPPVIHGDIKPSNVLLGSDCRAKVADFGLARIKTEGEFGIEMFSQELGRSQELWKSQDLSGNQAAVSTEIGTPAETTEVDFALALQASSSKSSRIDFPVRNPNLNFCLLNPNGIVVNEGECKGNGNFKGKEVFGGEDWSKFGPYDDELGSIDHSKELSANAVSSPPAAVDDRAANSKLWGRDWWWRQDGSGELCSKDYVMEWIGSQICPSSNPDWDDEKKNSPKKLDLDDSNQVEKMDGADETQFRELGPDDHSKKEAKASGSSCNGCSKKKKKHRKMKEWWKEEYFAEISKKGSKLRKLEGKWKKGFKMAHFNLGHKLQLRRIGSSLRKESRGAHDLNADISFRQGWKKKKSRSVGSDMWSGDLFSRELSSTTSMRGTVCYVAPEYGGCGYLMEKADIYSLGVLILVIVSGRRPLHVLSSPMKLEKANLISWCRHLAHKGNVLDLVDDRLKDTYNKDQALLCINLALMCLQKMPEMRPEIGDIVKILKGEMDLPSLPFEFSPSPPSKLFSRSRRRPAADAE